jgi:hypothetical protein
MNLIRLVQLLLMLVAAGSPAVGSPSAGSAAAGSTGASATRSATRTPGAAGVGAYPRRTRPPSTPFTPAGTLYVDGACPSGSGADGTAGKPFCTISAAAAVVSPGQTVVVEPGAYNETVIISRSGTAAAPITFLAANTMDGVVRVGAITAQVTGPVLTVQGVQHVVIRGFVIDTGIADNAVLIKDSSDITLDQGATHSLDATSVVVTGASSHVTISRVSVSSFAPAIRIDPGISGTTVTTNTVLPGRGTGPAILATDAPGTVVTSNTIYGGCVGVGVAGASPGGTVENNIVAAVSLTCTTTRVGVSVSTGSVPQTVDYNLIQNLSGTSVGSVAYSWAGVSYPDPASFTAATGQGVHDIVANPGLETYFAGGDIPWYTPAYNSPAIDSADASAPGELATDEVSAPHLDDPTTANKGTGVGYADRGAIEVFLNVSETWSCATFTTAPGGSPQSAMVTDAISTTVATDGPWGTFAYLFDDSPYPVIAPAGSVVHHFATPGPHSVQLMLSDTAFTKDRGYRCSSQITLEPDYQRRTFQ